jgi:hypothetical protein
MTEIQKQTAGDFVIRWWRVGASLFFLLVVLIVGNETTKANESDVTALKLNQQTLILHVDRLQAKSLIMESFSKDVSGKLDKVFTMLYEINGKLSNENRDN